MTSTVEHADGPSSAIMDPTTALTTTAPPPVHHWQADVYTQVFTYCSPIILVLGTVNNVLAILVLQSRRMRASGTNFILTALAAADLGVLYTTLLRSWILFVSKGQVDVRGYDINACKVHIFFTYFFTQLSPVTLAFITVERVISVCVPLQAKEICRRSNTVKVWVVLLVILAGFNSIAFFSVSYENRLADSGFSCNFNEQVYHGVYITHNILSSYMPCGVIFLGNGLIVYKLIQADRVRSEQMQASDGSSTTASTTRMLVVVSACFLLFTVPLSIYINANHYWPIGSPDSYVRAKSLMAYSILYQLFCLNNAVNFILYIAFGRVYRRALVQVICCRAEEVRRTTQMSKLSTSGMMSESQCKTVV